MKLFHVGFVAFLEISWSFPETPCMLFTAEVPSARYHTAIFGEALGQVERAHLSGHSLNCPVMSVLSAVQVPLM